MRIAFSDNHAFMYEDYTCAADFRMGGSPVLKILIGGLNFFQHRMCVRV